MLQSYLIGHLGADCAFKSSGDKQFTTFRVAHNERWTSQDGVVHESVMWVDCIMNDWPKVGKYLKAGTLVYVSGNISTRVYSSEKDRCMKAGITINVQRIELLGGVVDDVPRRLYDEQGQGHDVLKYYWVDFKGGVLKTPAGQAFAVDDNGWCLPMDRVQTELNSGQTDAPSK